MGVIPSEVPDFRKQLGDIPMQLQIEQLGMYPLRTETAVQYLNRYEWEDPRSQDETLTALSHELEGGTVTVDGEAGIACEPGDLPERFMELGSSQGKAQGKWALLEGSQPR